jgi:AraC-like DNA-binding protein
VKIDQFAVERALETLVDRPVDFPIAFSASLPLNAGAARDWVRLLLTIAQRQLGSPDSLMRHAVVWEPLTESLIRGLLLVAKHPCSQALAAPAESGRLAAVRDAMDIIEATPHLPLTTSTLARQCYVSVRTLQQGFERHLGMSPMAYLRAVRQRHAHRDRRSADPSHTTVALIAHRWGFTQLGRSPSHTTRPPARRRGKPCAPCADATQNGPGNATMAQTATTSAKRKSLADNAAASRARSYPADGLPTVANMELQSPLGECPRAVANVGRAQGSAASDPSVRRPGQNTIPPPATPHSIRGRVRSRCAMPVPAYGLTPGFQPQPRLERRTACTWRIRIRSVIYSRLAEPLGSNSRHGSASRSRSYFGAVNTRWRGSLIAYVLVDDTGTHVCHFGALSEAIDDERVEAFVVLNGYVNKEVLAARNDKQPDRLGKGTHPVAEPLYVAA